MDKRRLRPKCGVAAFAKLLTTLVVAALFASGGALPFGRILVYPQPAKGLFMQIATNWPSYFKHWHEGLGTTYERFILLHHFKHIRQKYSIDSVVETPCFGMTGITGINSIWWAANGVPVTIVDHDPQRISMIKDVWDTANLPVRLVTSSPAYDHLPFENGSFDMAWNFAALIFVDPIDDILREMSRVAKKLIFVCIPNRRNIIAVLRRQMSDKRANLFMANANPIKIIDVMASMNWMLQEDGYFDIPPWPDIAMNKEDLLHKMGLSTFVRKRRDQNQDRLCIMDYFSGTRKDMGREVLKYNKLENAPSAVKKLWAHHRYLLFTPNRQIY